MVINEEHCHLRAVDEREGLIEWAIHRFHSTLFLKRSICLVVRLFLNTMCFIDKQDIYLTFFIASRAELVSLLYQIFYSASMLLSVAVTAMECLWKLLGEGCRTSCIISVTLLAFYDEDALVVTVKSLLQNIPKRLVCVVLITEQHERVVIWINHHVGSSFNQGLSWLKVCARQALRNAFTLSVAEQIVQILAQFCRHILRVKWTFFTEFGKHIIEQTFLAFAFIVVAISQACQLVLFLVEEVDKVAEVNFVSLCLLWWVIDNLVTSTNENIYPAFSISRENFHLITPLL